MSFRDHIRNVVEMAKRGEVSMTEQTAEVFTVPKKHAVDYANNTSVFGIVREYMNEANELIDEIMEECPERILSVNVFARSTNDKPPNVNVRFSAKAEMTGMKEWLIAKVKEWYVEKTGKMASFLIEEWLYENRIKLIGEDLSDIGFPP